MAQGETEKETAPDRRAPLFRPEVLASRQGQWLGSIKLGRPLSFDVICMAALGAAIALIAFAIWGEITRKVTVHGVLLPAGGLINVSAPQAGVIAEIFVREGDIVNEGQRLLRLKSERLTVSGDASKLNAQSLATRRLSLETERRLTQENLRQRSDSLNQRESSLQTELRQAQGELDSHQLRLQLGQKSLERQQQLARDGFVAAAQVQQKEEELLDLKLRERNAERNLQAMQRDLQAVRADRQALEIQTKTMLAQLERSSASLTQETTESESRDGLTVVATQTSRVSVLTLGEGQSIHAGQTLANLVPLSASKSTANPSELQAQLYAPSRTAGFAKSGQVVWLRYASFPYQKFGMAQGKVIAVSRSPIAPQDLPNGQAQALLYAAQANEPMYRITVKLPRQTINTYGEQTPLVAGMGLDADVQQDSRKIWEWLLEPILAVTGRKRI